MISTKKLNFYLHVAKGTCSEECQKIITQLVDEVRKLNNIVFRVEGEAMWLADQLENTTEFCIRSHNSYDHCGHEFENGECAKCWRQAAMDACEDGNHD